MNFNSLGEHSKYRSQLQEERNPFFDKEQNKNKRERKVKINLDIQNKPEFNLNKPIKKSNFRIKGTFIKKGNILNLENLEKLNKFNKSILSNINISEFPNSSSSVKNYCENKNHTSGKNLPINVLFTEGSINNNQKINQSFHNKGKLNQTKINFLNLYFYHLKVNLQNLYLQKCLMVFYVVPFDAH